ncbi:hypothetical protein MnTg02_00189 [bacterium MnTg02]|nr:hypothetical protein MnTg02_00189 [bacterium MnTg02]
MRIAELVMAAVMALFSIYLMWKSTELNIGWISGEGPGGGAWPFWLAAIMLLCCIWIMIQWFRRKSPLSKSTEIYMNAEVIKGVGLVAGALTITIFLFHFVGVYGALPLFLIFYIRILGRHSWLLTGMFAALTPIVMFFFFEIALKITLPKGYTEPAFYPLYEMFL